jgi:glutamyl-tRNA synthetase
VSNAKVGAQPNTRDSGGNRFYRFIFTKGKHPRAQSSLLWQVKRFFLMLMRLELCGHLSNRIRVSLPSTRVRFAPSPTGLLHVGGLRTALYNYLYAKRQHGQCILRIEDTDRSRFVEGATENLIAMLEWAGLDYDEGPQKGGPLGPYVQSERLSVYRQHAQKLLDTGKAYFAFDTPEELGQMRKDQERMGISPKYDRRALQLTSGEVQAKLEAGEPAVIRMKVPDGRTIVVDDIIRGRVEIASDLVDDQVLLKSDGYPTYHLANVVDDHLMEVSHVIRGEEWLSSTPKHVLLYEYFGWELPQFAHLPLLLNPDKSKLSKRQGDVAVEDYKKKGYLPEALVNFVAFLGWNPGDEREVFSLDELIQEFSLERVGKAGAVFNLEKLNWLNFQHLRKKPDNEVLAMLKGHLEEAAIGSGEWSDRYLLSVISAMRERVTFIKDFTENGLYFFRPPDEYDPGVVMKRWKKESRVQLAQLLTEFSFLQSPGKEDFEAALHRTAETLKIKNSDLIHPLRLAVSGMGAGPGLYDILFILGKDETIRRIRKAIETIP